jgi:murein DD-endopeptidase MepM/ murein hydrolase activator NlpD
MSRTDAEKKADENFLKSIKTEMDDLIEEVDAFKKKERKSASAILTKHRNPNAQIIGKVDESQILNKLYEDIPSPPENSIFDPYTQPEKQDQDAQQYETKKMTIMKENYNKDTFNKQTFQNFYNKYTIINKQNDDLKERINTIYTNITNKIQYYQGKKLKLFNPIQKEELKTLKGYEDDISPYYKGTSDYLISDDFAILLQKFSEIISEPQNDQVLDKSTGGKRHRRSTKKRKSSKKSRKARRSRRHRRNRSSKK